MKGALEYEEGLVDVPKLPEDYHNLLSQAAGAMVVNCSGWSLTRTPGHMDVREKHVETGHATKDECADAIRAPKVALLFQTQAGMPHAQLWQQWLGSIADLLPLDSIRDEACRPQPLVDMVTLSRTCFQSPVLPAHQRQHLFSIYLHNPPDQAAFPQDHVFFQTEVQGRVPAFMGHQPRTIAVKKLLEVALWEPLNQRFVTLSEASIPLYPPEVVYRQLLSETFSRINACDSKGLPHAAVMQRHDRKDSRWQPAMAGFGIPKEMWRRHHQRLSLTRAHAWLAALDDHIIKAFEGLCESLPDKPAGTCYSDEHYISTLLSYHSQDIHTDCLGLVANDTWSTSPPANQQNRPAFDQPLQPQITMELLLNMRRPSMHCMYDVAIVSAARTFGTFLDAFAPGPVQYDARALHLECPLFGDGFRAETVPQLQQAVFCPRGRDVLQILPCSMAEAASKYTGQHQPHHHPVRHSAMEY
ncbi:hypothetical protein WJX74_002664 [Apatococcus lobatus]|uniref:Uncharacterized protein n=1 Tax=Apatococcus lobatus TaxID=904363 RepID=A0AAW1RIY8_9CHLO